MTTGFPDEQGFATWRADNLLPSSAPALPAGANVFGPFLTSNFAGVLLRVVPSAGAGQVRVRWWLDAAATIPAGTDIWSVNASCGLAARIPARGFYADLTVTVAAPGPMTATVTLIPDNNVAPVVTYPVTGSDITSGLITYAASATVFYVLPFVQPGLASVMAQPVDTTAKLDFAVVSFNPDGTLSQYLARLGTPAAPVVDLVGLTADICGLQVINTDAAATHQARLTLVPGLSGQG